MKNTLMGTETVPMEGFHLVQKLYSFLDIPGRSPGHLHSTALGNGSKEGSEVRAARRREISDLGFLSDLARDSGGWRVMAATPAFSCAGRGAAQVYPVLERVQRRDDPLQCVEINTVRRFGHTRSRLVTKRVHMVDSAFRLGRKAAHAVCEVTLAALLRFASLVAENQQSSMRKTSKLAAGWC